MQDHGYLFQTLSTFMNSRFGIILYNTQNSGDSIFILFDKFKYQTMLDSNINTIALKGPCLVYCKLIMLTLLVVCCKGTILLFDKHAIQKIFQARMPTLFLFAGNNSQSAIAKQVFQELDQFGIQDVLLCISDSNDGFGMFQRLADYLDVDTQYTPQVMIYGQHQQKYYFEGQQISMQALQDFINKALKGQIQPYIRSSLPPKEQQNTGHVKIVVGVTFKKIILDSNKQFLVNFYAPWCDHCQIMESIYEQAARRLQGNQNLVFIKIDGTENQVVNMEIKDFPTIIFYTRNKKQIPISYTGGLSTADQIIDWLKRHVTYQWIEPRPNREDLQPSQQL